MKFQGLVSYANGCHLINRNFKKSTGINSLENGNNLENDIGPLYGQKLDTWGQTPW